MPNSTQERTLSLWSTAKELLVEVLKKLLFFSCIKYLIMRHLKHLVRQLNICKEFKMTKRNMNINKHKRQSEESVVVPGHVTQCFVLLYFYVILSYSLWLSSFGLS